MTIGKKSRKSAKMLHFPMNTICAICPEVEPSIGSESTSHEALIARLRLAKCLSTKYLKICKKSETIIAWLMKEREDQKGSTQINSLRAIC